MSNDITAPNIRTFRESTERSDADAPRRRSTAQRCEASSADGRLPEGEPIDVTGSQRRTEVIADDRRTFSRVTSPNMRTFGLNSREFYEAITPPPDPFGWGPALPRDRLAPKQEVIVDHDAEVSFPSRPRLA